ncbi:hypothetical protein [Aggregatilinea lenta]|uniref:hypothetical protein n=1 Tax=Aggregatilinea lenta TaxID=913108 RepID=UPI0013C2DE08|nr:hypothetical protein [Aggregatilinea lenta]
MNNASKLDERLAAFTDELRAGADPATPADLAYFAPVVRGLERLIDGAPADDMARMRITQGVMAAWDASHTSSRRRWRSLRTLEMLVAGLGWALLVVTLLAANGTDGISALEGTALGGQAGMAAVVVAVSAAVVGLLWWLRHLRA